MATKDEKANFLAPKRTRKKKKKLHDALDSALANSGYNVTLDLLHQASEDKDLVSFSKARWEDVAGRWGLPKLRPPLVLEIYLPTKTIPLCSLPMKFHVDAAVRGWQALDIYALGGASSLQEAQNVRMMETYIQPIVALFHGRVHNRPEFHISGNRYTKGGRVEFQIIMIGRVMFIIIESKKKLEEIEAAAQMFLELQAAYSNAERQGIHNIPVYGLLSDLEEFHFFAFEGNQLYALECIPSPSNEGTRLNYLRTFLKHDHWVNDMIKILNALYSIVLDSFIRICHATAEKSRNRTDNDPTSSIFMPILRPTPPPQDHQTSIKDAVLAGEASTSSHSSETIPTRPSFDKWLQAAIKAGRAQQCASFKDGDVEACETNFKEAIKCLEQAVLMVPRSRSSDPLSAWGEAHMLTREKIESIGQNIVYEYYSQRWASGSSAKATI